MSGHSKCILVGYQFKSERKRERGEREWERERERENWPNGGNFIVPTHVQQVSHEICDKTIAHSLALSLSRSPSLPLRHFSWGKEGKRQAVNFRCDKFTFPAARFVPHNRSSDANRSHSHSGSQMWVYQSCSLAEVARGVLFPVRGRAAKKHTSHTHSQGVSLACLAIKRGLKSSPER